MVLLGLTLNLGYSFEVVGCTCWKATPLLLKPDDTWSLLLELAGFRKLNLMLVLYY
jgi:hypothetical protein